MEPAVKTESRVEEVNQAENCKDQAKIRKIPDQLGDDRTSYGSVSAGREKWPFNVLFFLKVEPPCDQT